ncbi:MAG: cyclin-dependent kinase regulatory subunit [Amphiamblys sp. WSBS2006]|nr:MAG: cyclin-dependent kinase regulatory subunit [Amphiamblys sp. WSBS2006]
MLRDSDASERRRKSDVAEHAGSIMYSRRYSDDQYEYRHVVLPKELAKYVPEDRLMAEAEWRSIGVQQSPGWWHYMIHRPERHILLFKRKKET